MSYNSAHSQPMLQLALQYKSAFVISRVYNEPMLLLAMQYISQRLLYQLCALN